jgi:hypothetical protein
MPDALVRTAHRRQCREAPARNTPPLGCCDAFMKPLTLFLFGIALAAGNAMAADSSFQERAAPHPALYSFVDVFRLTLSGPMPGPVSAEPTAEARIRVAAPQVQPAVEMRFTVSSVRRPDKWLLLLAGLALAGWVAHRRLVHSL